jgi:hypothetical protein
LGTSQRHDAKKHRHHRTPGRHRLAPPHFDKKFLLCISIRVSFVRSIRDIRSSVLQQPRGPFELPLIAPRATLPKSIDYY